jgi:protease-4
VKKKRITKSVSLITRKNDHHWVSTDSKSNCHYLCREIQSGGRCQHYGRRFMRRSLQDARRNKDVKAIVLRIDSPEEVLLHQI